jgi:signal transduction histidine kinase
LVTLLLEETERERLEAELRQSQKMEAVGRLAGGIAHDFNNLLTVIMGRADLLASKVELDNPLQRDVELIRQVGRRAASLTSQLLAFSRKQLTTPRVLDVNAVMRELEAMLHRIIGEDTRMVHHPCPGALHIKADPVQVEQVVLNLVINARDAMPGGGQVEITTWELTPEDSWPRRPAGLGPGCYAVISVRDEGVGIDQAAIGQIFEPFFTTKEIGRGTGLGLATVYGIMKNHGGHVDVESTVGSGATFRVFFPLASKEEVERADSSTVELSPAAAGTILLVEDEDAIRHLLCEQLTMWGYRVLDAGNGAEALDLANKLTGPIDLLLTDVVMPQMGGPELMTNLAQRDPR